MLQSTGNDALQNACVKVFRIRPDATEHWRPVGDYALRLRCGCFKMGQDDSSSSLHTYKHRRVHAFLCRHTYTCAYIDT